MCLGSSRIRLRFRLAPIRLLGRGRVIDPPTGAPVPGAYVAGWIKRGPSGFIGSNRSCAQESRNYCHNLCKRVPQHCNKAAATAQNTVGV